MRTRNFYNHPTIDDMHYAAFSVVRDTIIFSGGYSDNIPEGDESSYKNFRGSFLVQLPKTSIKHPNESLD